MPRFITPKPMGSGEGGWVVSFPTGSSDYFNVRHDVGSAIDADISLAVADFGASSSYPTVGLFNANTGLDPSGATPDLSSPIATTSSPAVLGGPIGDHCNIDLPSNSISGLVTVLFSCPLATPVSSVSTLTPTRTEKVAGTTLALTSTTPPVSRLTVSPPPQ